MQTVVTQWVEDCSEGGQWRSETHFCKILEDVASYSQVDFLSTLFFFIIFKKLVIIAVNSSCKMFVVFLFCFVFCYLCNKHKLVLGPRNWGGEIQESSVFIEYLNKNTWCNPGLAVILTNYLQMPVLYVTFFRLFQFTCRLEKIKVPLQSVLHLLKDRNPFSLWVLFLQCFLLVIAGCYFCQIVFVSFQRHTLTEPLTQGKKDNVIGFLMFINVPLSTSVVAYGIYYKMVLLYSWQESNDGDNETLVVFCPY